MIFKQSLKRSKSWHRFNQWMQPAIRYIVFIFKRFQEDECLVRASSLTYTSLLAFVPLMTVSFGIFSAFPVFASLRQPVENFIFSNFVPATGEMVQDYFTTFVDQTARMSIFGLVFLIVTAILLMFNVERAMNSIWRVPTIRSPVSKFLLYWAVLTLAPILMGLSFTISSYLVSLPLLDKIGDFSSNGNWFLSILPFLSSLSTFTLLYVVVPNCRVRICHGLAGALVTSILFEIAKKSFAIYFQNFGTYELIYGAFATIPLFLIWLYWVWIIVLIGAEITHALSAYYQHRSKVKVDGFTHAIHWLGHLWQAQKLGRGLQLMQLVDKDHYNYQITPDKMIDRLLSANLIMAALDDKYILSRDLTRLSLYELSELLPWPFPDVEYLQASKLPWDQSLVKIFSEIKSSNREALDFPLDSIFTS